jgi:hypothetical protein
MGWDSIKRQIIVEFDMLSHPGQGGIVNMYWLRHIHDRARTALSILKISEIEEILAPFVAKFAQAIMKPYYLEREIFVKRCNRICFAVRQIWAEIFDFEGDAVRPPMISLLLLYYI